MPTLQRRLDGNYFIRRRYDNHQTWQVTGHGVRVLSEYGVRCGCRFDHRLFWLLCNRGDVYVGSRGRPVNTHRVYSTSIEMPAGLRNRFTMLRASLISQDLVAARQCIFHYYSDEDQSKLLFAASRVDRWKFVDCRASSIDTEVSKGLFVRDVAVVTVTVRGHVVREVWLRDDDWELAISDTTFTASK